MGKDHGDLAGSLDGIQSDLAYVKTQMPVPRDRTEEIAGILDRLACELTAVAVVASNGYVPPLWWASYTAEFPQWRAWRGDCQFWARLPGTMRVHHADNPADLARQVRAGPTGTDRTANDPR
jgi:hypothetical protein